jgi:N-dimethylarginine dimethylaminohydrolase
MTLLHELFNADMVDDSYDVALEQDVWNGCFGAYNYYSPVEKVLMHCPGEEARALEHASYDEGLGAFIARDDEGRALSYFVGKELPDFDEMTREHQALAATMAKEGIEVVDYAVNPSRWTNRLFARDSALITPHGAILCRMSSYFRQGEVPIIEKTLADSRIPIVGAIQGRGFIEGGSFSIIDSRTAIIGRSVRNNDEGIDQLRHLLSLQGLELLVVDVPANKIHLDEMFVMLSRDKALVDTRIIPHWFLDMLRRHDIEPLELDPRDPPLTNNCLAIAPGKIVFSQKGAFTADMLSARGLEILPVDVSELNKMGGGIHCLTLPLYRRHE